LGAIGEGLTFDLLSSFPIASVHGPKLAPRYDGTMLEIAKKKEFE
jgi:hypothetical protein